ncbi:MAG: HD domain-containing protein, partial [Bacteroidota bacterium]
IKKRCISAGSIRDVFQFLILLVVLPIIAALALKDAGGLKSVLTQVPATQLRIFDHPRFSFYLVSFLTKIVFQFSLIDPALIQRFLMAKSKKQLRHQFLALAAFSPALYLAIMLIGLAGIILYPNLKGHAVVPQIVNDILPVGIKGVAIAGLLAVTMATIDSFLHAAGLTLVHDVVKPLCDKRKLKINELRWTQYATVFISLFAIAIGLAHADDLYGLLLISYEFTCPLLAFPLWCGIMGLKPDKQAFYTAAGVTSVVLLSAKAMLPASHGYLTPFISVIVNGMVFLGMHIVRNKGLVIVKREEAYEYLLKPRHKSILARLQQLLPTPQRIVRYSQQRVASYGASYTLLGLFCIINYIVPYFMWEYDNVQNYEPMLYLRFVGAMACGLLVVKDKWLPSLLPYLPTFWHFTLLFCIPFTSTVMFLLTQGSIEWLINVAITIMFLIVLVDWLTFFILTALGIVLGVLFYRAAIGPVSLQLDFSTGYLLVYQGVFATLIGLLFARRRERRIEREHRTLKNQDEASREGLLQAAKERHQALKALQVTGVEKLLTVAKDLQKLDVKPSALDKLHDIEARLIPVAFQLQGIDARARDYLRLKVESIPLPQFLAQVQERLQAKGIAQHVRLQERTGYAALVCDATRMASLLADSIVALWSQATPRPGEEEVRLLLGLEDTVLTYPLPDVEEGYIKQVPALRLVITTGSALPPLAPSYAANLAGSQATESDTPQVLAHAANGRVIKAHYGYKAVSAQSITYVIPANVGDVRPRDMDKSYMELESAPERANDRFKNEKVDAQAQEKEFLAAVEQRSQADLGLVKIALELIKWYHGPVKRHTKEPFYLHPMAVAQIVLDYNTDTATILGALLHDTVEDTAILVQHLESVFGKETAKVVDVATHLQSIEGSIYKVKLSAAENIRMLERTGNKRGLYVKLADRMHNVRTIGGHSKLEKRQLIAQETLDFFVPLAERLGLQETAQELKERCLAVMNERA